MNPYAKFFRIADLEFTSLKKKNIMKIKITADLNVIPFNRPRFKNGRGFNSARYSEFKENLGYKARTAMKGREPIKGAFKISIDFYKKSRQEFLNKNFGDLDNFIKSVMDSLNGICYEDDAQCVEFTRCRKFKSDEPKIIITIEEVEIEEC